MLHYDSINFGNISKSKIKDETFIYWGDEKVGKIKKGKSIYRPIAEAFEFRIFIIRK